MAVPTVKAGDIVYYSHASSLVMLPAMVCRVLNNGALSLHVFRDGGMPALPLHEVHYSSERKTACWSATQLDDGSPAPVEKAQDTRSPVPKPVPDPAAPPGRRTSKNPTGKPPADDPPPKDEENSDEDGDAED